MDRKAIRTQAADKAKRGRVGWLCALAAAVLMAASLAVIANYYTLCYDVYYDGENVGTAYSKKEAEGACVGAEKIEKTASQRKLRLVMRIAPVSEIDTSGLLERILDRASNSVECCALVADGATVAYLESETAAANAVETFAARFESANIISVSDNYEIVPTKAARKDISTIDEAVGQLNETGAIKVRYTKSAANEYSVDFEEETVEDSTIPIGTQIVAQEGAAGRGEVKYTVYFENGNITRIAPAEKTVVVAPSPKITKIGTKVMGLPEEIDCPIKGVFTSDFGERWGRAHTGIDIGASEGTPVYAPAGGRVIFAEACGGYGNYVKVDHGEGCVTAYAHLSKIDVTVGQTVMPGDKIGEVGTTGNVTGPHLHFEIIVNGTFIDPKPFIKS